MKALFLLAITILTTLCHGTSTRLLARLREGDSMASDAVLVSPEGTFSAGFYSVGENAACFSVWFSNSVDKSVVWSANRDSPVSLVGSRLTLSRLGNLALTDPSRSTVWSTGTTAASSSSSSSPSPVEARLLESGNLVLLASKIVETGLDTGDSYSEILWESFGFPTDTLLPTQRLTRNTTLVSTRSRGSLSSGVYNFRFDDNNVLNLVYEGPEISSVYWPREPGGGWSGTGRTPYNSSRVAVLDDSGAFLSSDRLGFKAFDYDYRSKKKRRLTLDRDGVPRIYSLKESSGEWEISWLPSRFDSCRVDGICGENGICGYFNNSVKPTCTCPDKGFRRRHVSDWSKGCEPVFSLSGGNTTFGFLRLPNTDYYGYDLPTVQFGNSLSECMSVCLNDALCRGFGYSSDGIAQCFPKIFLINGYHMPTSQSVVYIKMPKTILAEKGTGGSGGLRCSEAGVVLSGGDETGEMEKAERETVKYLMAFVGSFGVIEAVCLGLWWWFIYRKRVSEEVMNMGYIALAMGFKKFPYSELKRATQNFREEIGKGGFGSVYKGTLADGRLVAVKRLEGVLQGDSEFWAEVSVIGNINHRNLVKMWGFCAENDNKLLVYEYVENSSLDKILFHDHENNNSNNNNNKASSFGLERRYNVALGTARGLSYLHEECLEWVLHCDVKPQNILLDVDLEPKVSDFGMSKLFSDGEAEGFSRVRGTRGYVAPEWTMSLRIDAKADVYSYGIVVLEILTGKCVSGEESLVQWATEKTTIEELVDPRLFGEGEEEKVDMEKVERLLRVALLCVQDDRNLRPAMSKVVELLLETEKEVE